MENNNNSQNKLTGKRNRRKAITYKNAKQIETLVTKPPLAKKNTRKLNKKKGIAFQNKFLPNTPRVHNVAAAARGINTAKLNRMIAENTFFNHINTMTSEEMEYIQKKLNSA